MAPSLRRSIALARDDVLVAGRRAEDVADLGRALDRHHLVAVHEGLERPHGIDLGDDHVRAHAPRAHRHPAPRPAVAADDEAPPGEQEVGGADDPVDRGLAGAVAVVEEVLGVGLVDRDDREGELALGLERLEPDDAGRRLLGAAEDLARAGRDGPCAGRRSRRPRRPWSAAGGGRPRPRCASSRSGRPRRGWRRRGCRTRRRARRPRRPAWRAGSTRRARRRRPPPSACGRGSRSPSSRGGTPRCGCRPAAAPARNGRGSRREPACAGPPTRCGQRPRERGRDP